MHKKNVIKLSILLITLLIVIVSIIRINKVNKDVISNDDRYRQVKLNEYFDANELSLKVKNIELLKNDQSDVNEIKARIDVKKVKDIKRGKYDKSYISELANNLKINVTSKNGTLILNRPSEYEGYRADNPDFIKVQNGEESFGNNARELVVRFQIKDDVLNGIKDNDYNLKLAIGKDSQSFKYDYINLTYEDISMK